MLSCLILVCLLAGAENKDFWAMGTDSGAGAATMLSSLSDEEVLGQIFMMTYPGTQVSPLLLDWIRKRALGGVKIFGWNAEDTAVLADATLAIQDAAAGTRHRIPPFIATDQEGGWIRHVKGETIITPGNMAIGASGYPQDAYRSAYYIGRELLSLGITMNFAPTVDLATRPRSQIIGPRAFSDDPMESAVLAASYVRGMSEAGIVCTAKHYPGHGDTELDSHGILPVITIDEKLLWERELIPYRVLSGEGVPAIMSGHLAYPKITGDFRPASLSKRLLTDILRTKIGFRGLIVTDDLYMSGAAVEGGFPEACILAVEAGNDIIMISRTLEFDDKAWATMLAAYRGNPVFRARVRESAGRIIEAKLRFLKPLGKNGVKPSEDAQARLASRESHDFFLEQALRATTVLEGRGLPLVSPAAGRVLLASQYQDFFTEGQKFFPDARRFYFSFQPWGYPLDSEQAVFESLLGSCDTVVINVASPAGARLAGRARAWGKRVYLISSLSPASAIDALPAQGAVAVYGFSRECFQAGFAVLSGMVEARGKLPISELK